MKNVVYILKSVLSPNQPIIGAFFNKDDCNESAKLYNDWETQTLVIDVYDNKLSYKEALVLSSGVEFLTLKNRFQYTPEDISEVLENEIFVFGSNLSGVHGAGAAKMAVDNFGAIYGEGIGLFGNSYAIPTKDENIRTLPKFRVKGYVYDFILFAQKNPKYNFLVTKVGCGLAGFRVEDIAPMFKDALTMKNVMLPKEFVYFIKN